MHSSVRQRWLDGDPFIRSSMEEVANLALEGRRVLLEKDYTQLTSLMNHNFDLRRYVNVLRFIDCVLSSSTFCSFFFTLTST